MSSRGKKTRARNERKRIINAQWKEQAMRFDDWVELKTHQLRHSLEMERIGERINDPH